MAEKLGPVLPFEGRNYVGICHMDVVAAHDVLSVPDVIDCAVQTTVVLKAGAAWIRVYFEDDGGHYQERWALKNGAQASLVRMAGQVAKDQLPYLRQFWAAKGRRYLLLVTTRNGDTLLIGTQATPAMLLITERTAGIDTGSDRNQYEVAFSLASRHPVPFYLPPTPVPPPGTACPTLAELMPSASTAEILAAVTAPQDAELATHYGASCPSLAELVALATDAALYASMSVEQATYIANQIISVIDGNGTPEDVVVDPGGGGPPPVAPDFSPADFSPTDFMTT